MVQQKVSIGIGFGKVLNEEIRERNGAGKKTPSLTEVLLPFGTRALARGDWLKIGDEYGADTGSQIQSQQSNIALLSALLLTIQFAFLYAFPGTWSDLITDSYLANLMGEDQLEVLHEVFLVSCLSSVVVNCMCMVYCVVVVLALGEITDLQEVNFLNIRMGISISGSLPLFILSIAIWACKTFLFQIFAARSLAGVILNIVLPILIVIWIMLAFFGKIIQAIYEVKYVQAIPRPADGDAEEGTVPRPLVTSPLYERKAQIDTWLRQFADECGRAFLSEDNFLVFVTYAARAKLKQSLGPNPDAVEATAVDVLELCEVSKTLARRAAAAEIERLVEAEERGEGPAPAGKPALGVSPDGAAGRKSTASSVVVLGPSEPDAAARAAQAHRA